MWWSVVSGGDVMLREGEECVKKQQEQEGKGVKGSEERGLCGNT